MISRSSSVSRDITIMGGGLAGLSLALQCRKVIPDADIAVIEKKEHPVPEAAFKVGESTVEAAATYFGEVLGLREHLLEQQLPKLGLRFFFPADGNHQIESRLELGGKRYAPVKSYQLDRGRFENFLARRCLAQNIKFVDNATIEEIELARTGRHSIQYRQASESHTVTCRWLIDASGRRALLKRKLGLQKDSPHRCNAVWFRLSSRLKIDDWTRDVEWQKGHEDKTSRWYSTNHLMGEGYWVWLIPLGSGATSVGIVASDEIHPLSTFNSLAKAMDWLDKHEPQCAERIREQQDDIQDFLAIKDYSVECKQVFSAKRWGITGEAGFFLDPFYSPGSDFIAFGNTFLTDLIRRDLKGRPFRQRAFTYDKIYKKFYYGTLTAYEGQYALFGSPQVMPVKILWDYLVYWSITGFFFMHGRLCNQTMYLRNLGKLSRLRKLNHCMQHLFRVWHRQQPPQEFRGTVDISQIPIIRESNQSLLDELNSRQFAQRFAENLQQLETLFWEIVDHAQLKDFSIPFARRSHAKSRKHVFEKVFAQTTPNAASVSGKPTPSAATIS